jgi:hypothetical protein
MADVKVAKRRRCPFLAQRERGEPSTESVVG